MCPLYDVIKTITCFLRMYTNIIKRHIPRVVVSTSVFDDNLAIMIVFLDNLTIVTVFMDNHATVIFITQPTVPIKSDHFLHSTYYEILDAVRARWNDFIQKIRINISYLYAAHIGGCCGSTGQGVNSRWKIRGFRLRYTARLPSTYPPRRKCPCLKLYCLRYNNINSVTIARLSTGNHYSPRSQSMLRGCPWTQSLLWGCPRKQSL